MLLFQIFIDVTGAAEGELRIRGLEADLFLAMDNTGTLVRNYCIL